MRSQVQVLSPRPKTKIRVNTFTRIFVFGSAPRLRLVLRRRSPARDKADVQSVRFISASTKYNTHVSACVFLFLARRQDYVLYFAGVRLLVIKRTFSPSAPCGEQIRLLRYKLSLFHRQPVSCRPQGPSENAVSISKKRCICCEFCGTTRNVSCRKQTRTSRTCANFNTAFPGCPREGGDVLSASARTRAG